MRTEGVIRGRFGLKRGLLIRYSTLFACAFAFSAADGAPLQSARVSQVIRDVSLLRSNAAASPASLNDEVRLGMAVRTGGQSRAELTFGDLTITRLGENTIFSLNEGTRQLHVEHGSVLLEVPPGAASVKIISSVATAGVSGGTAMFGTGPPAKFMVLEGVGTFYPAGHPQEAVTLHGGEMVTLSADGRLVTAKFDVKAVMETSHLVIDFPDLANLPLILQVIDEQQTTQLTPGTTQPPLKDLVDVISVNTTSNPNITGTPGPSASPLPSASPSPTPPPSKFGPLPTITSPNPYVITSGTQINTDPSITTNGATDFGKIYRGPALDGSEFDYLFGSTNSFDTTIGTFFNGNGNGVPVAVFKFSHLELIGDPTITIPSGATTFLGLVSVGDVTSGAPGGTLTFAGLDRLFIATQDGSITLGPEIAFSGISHVTFYARGTGSNLTLGSAISGADVVHLDSQGTVQINGDITASTEFRSFSGGDFLVGTGMITAQTIDIESLANVNVDSRQFPNVTGDVTFIAGGTLNAMLFPGSGGTSHFTGTSLTAQGNTINIQGTVNPTTFDLETADVSIVAGNGGIQAPTILFANGNSLLLQTTNGGDINIYGRLTPSNDNGGNVAVGTIDASGAFSAVADVTNVEDLTAGTSIMVGGTLASNNITGGTTIDVGGTLFATNVTAGGNITANGVGVITINAPTSILTAGSQGIFAEVTENGAAEQNTFNISSIVSPNGMDFSGNQYGGINGLSSGGLLTVNANTLTFDSATGIAFANFNGADAGSFSGGGPASGGDGGTFIVNAAGDITANNGSDISATTGNNVSGDNGFSGAGGTVKLVSTGGSVTVNDTIQVSSDDPIPGQTPPPPIRRSASGGTILLQSNLTSGTGITVGANGQLLSLLDANAPGPGGSITLSTMGAAIVVNGTIEADRGTITMDQNDPAGSTPTITIDGATIIAQTLNITSPGEVDIGLNNAVTLGVGAMAVSVDNSNGNISTGGNIILNPAGNLNTAAGVTLSVQNTNGTITNGGNITLTVGGNVVTTNGLSLILQNYDESANPAGNIGTGGNLSATVSGNVTAGYVDMFINNRGGGTIGSGGNLTLTVNGSLTTTGDAGFAIQTRFDNGSNNSIIGSTIGSAVMLEVSAASVNIGGSLANTVFNSGLPFSGISNRGSTIDGDATYEWNVPGGVSIGGTAPFMLLNDGGNNVASPVGGTIHGNALLQVVGGSLSASGFVDALSNVNPAVDAEINNKGGGVIDDNATINFNITGDITANNGTNAPGDAVFLISNEQNSNGLAGGSIGGAATITIGAADITAAGDFSAQIFNQRALNATGANGGSIGTNAAVNITGSDLSVGGELFLQIVNQNLGSGSGSGGSIGGNASINLTVSGDITTTGTDTNSSGTPGDMAFNIFNQGNNGNTVGGSITSDATVNIQTANISAANDFVAQIVNFNGGTIGGKAALTLNATGDVGTGGLLFFGLFNNPGAIESDASVDVSAASLTAGSTFEAFIENVGGTIGGNATVQVGTPLGLNADHLFVVIDSSSGGSVGGNETINMNISGTATVNNEATVQILGPDPTGSAAINFNGGAYQIGGTFFNTIDGNGTITFNNTDIHANVVQAGVFGANGSLIIGGSGSNTISADTILKLYAPGSNGLLKFIASVTLSSGTAMDLAANTITINPGVTVTIAGIGGAANVYTNNANYSGFGGINGSNGTFAGNGANNPQPLANAPTFGAAPGSFSSSSTTGVSNKTLSSGSVSSSVNAAGSAISVSNSGELLSLLNSSTAGAGGKITVSNKANRSRNSRGAKNVQSRAGVQKFPATVAALPRTQ